MGLMINKVEKVLWFSKGEIEMKVRNSSQIVDIYGRADTEGKIRIVLDNYITFMNMVNAYEDGLIDEIKEERMTNRRLKHGDLGVRVQTSGYSNPTSSEGDEDVEVETAVKAGDYITALRGADCYDYHKAEIVTLRNMRHDFVRVCQQFGAAGKDGKLFERYLLQEFDLIDIADTEGLTIDAVKQRFRRVRKIITEGASRWIKKSDEYFVMKKGA